MMLMMIMMTLVYFRGWDDSNEMPLALRSLACFEPRGSKIEEQAEAEARCRSI